MLEGGQESYVSIPNAGSILDKKIGEAIRKGPIMADICQRQTKPLESSRACSMPV